MQTPYVTPQENGRRADVRWATLTDAAGRGLRVDGRFGLTVRRWTDADLAAATHRNELTPGDRLWLTIDAGQQGIGTGSCGPGDVARVRAHAPEDRVHGRVLTVVVNPRGLRGFAAMATRLNPYISFAGNARQAMEFYEQVFGGTLALNTFSEFDDSGQAPDGIMHAQLETPSGYTIMGADMPPGQPHEAGQQHDGEPERRRRRRAARLLGPSSPTAARSRCRWRSRCGATSSACASTASASRGWSTSRRRQPRSPVRQGDSSPPSGRRTRAAHRSCRPVSGSCRAAAFSSRSTPQPGSSDGYR